MFNRLKYLKMSNDGVTYFLCYDVYKIKRYESIYEKTRKELKDYIESTSMFNDILLCIILMLTYVPNMIIAIVRSFLLSKIKNQ